MNKINFLPQLKFFRSQMAFLLRRKSNNPLAKRSREYFILLLVLMGHQALAQQKTQARNFSCQPVDLRNEFNFGLAKNQKSLSWCYAYTAADLISFRLQRNISAFDLAVKTQKEYRPIETDQEIFITELSGAPIQMTFAAAKKYGVCAASKVSSAGKASEFLKEVEDLIVQIQRIKIANKGQDLAQKIRQICSKKTFALNKVFPTTDFHTITQVLSQIQPGVNSLPEVFDQVCGSRISIPNLDFEGFIFQQSESSSAKIREQLNKSNPVIIVYSSKTLRDPRHAGPVDHASTVIAMRPTETGQCEYLVRNTWGAENPKLYHSSLRKKLSQGNVWISEDMIKKMVREIHYLK